LDAVPTPPSPQMIKKKVKKLKPVKAAYIAALIDGEGSVTLCRKNKHVYRRIDISINNSDKKMLEWVLKAVGAGKILPKKIYSEKHTPTFTYRIVCREALPFLKQILPYLHTYKKDRTKLILKEFMKLTPRNGKYSEKMLNKKIDFTKRFFAINPTQRKRVHDWI